MKQIHGFSLQKRFLWGKQNSFFQRSNFLCFSYLSGTLERDHQIFSTGIKWHYFVVLCSCNTPTEVPDVLGWGLPLAAFPSLPLVPRGSLADPGSHGVTNPCSILAVQWIFLEVFCNISWFINGLYRVNGKHCSSGVRGFKNHLA